MLTTDVPPVQYTTYCQNNLLCMGSNLLLLLLMFFFGYTIDKVVSTLFFCNSKVMILCQYAGPSSVKIGTVFRSILWKRCPENSYISFKNGNEGLLYERVADKSLLKLNTSQLFFVHFFTWNISSINHLQ